MECAHFIEYSEEKISRNDTVGQPQSAENYVLYRPSWKAHGYGGSEDVTADVLRGNRLANGIRTFEFPIRGGDLDRRVGISLAPTSHPLTIVPRQCYNSSRHTTQL